MQMLNRTNKKNKKKTKTMADKERMAQERNVGKNTQ